jgi:hypothetical protein
MERGRDSIAIRPGGPHVRDPARKRGLPRSRPTRDGTGVGPGSALLVRLYQTPEAGLRNLHQFHLPVAPAVQNVEISCLIAENEQVPIAEFRFLDSLFHRHGP